MFQIRRSCVVLGVTCRVLTGCGGGSAAVKEVPTSSGSTKATSSLLMQLILFREHFWGVCGACVAGLFEALQAA